MPSALLDRPSAPPSQHFPAQPGTATRPPRQLASDDLLRDAREVLIRHGDQLYRLRHTRAGKLILTK